MARETGEIEAAKVGDLAGPLNLGLGSILANNDGYSIEFVLCAFIERLSKRLWIPVSDEIFDLLSSIKWSVIRVFRQKRTVSEYSMKCFPDSSVRVRDWRSVRITRAKRMSSSRVRPGSFW